jgi:hypothetical protein
MDVTVYEILVLPVLGMIASMICLKMLDNKKPYIITALALISPIILLWGIYVIKVLLPDITFYLDVGYYLMYTTIIGGGGLFFISAFIIMYKSFGYVFAKAND